MKSIKEFVRTSFLGGILIAKLHQIEGIVLPRIIPDEVAVKRYFKKVTGKELDLENPTTFVEKINWYKLNDHNPLMVKCADKVGLRDYVSENGYGEYLNDCLGVFDDVADIDVSKLPQCFVMKAAHGSHMNIIVKDKDSVNWKKYFIVMKNWLKQDIYWGGREWVYKDIPKRIIIEKYLEDETGELRDFKMFCFNGVPKFVQVDIGRFGEHHVRNFYDLNWNLLDITDDVGNDPTLKVSKPLSLDKMVEIAQTLSKPFQFVRVDFYEVNTKPYVGEMTFFHMGGNTGIKSEEWEKTIGGYWRLEKKN